MACMKTEKQVMNLLYGISTKNTVLFVIVYFCVAAMVACIWMLGHFGGGSISSELPFIVVALILFIYATVLCVRNSRHVKELKEKYKRLTEEEKREVRGIAEKFDGKGLGISEHFVYGFMARVTEFRRARDIIVFEYIPVSQIVFIDTLKSKEQEEKEKAFQRKTQAALMGAGMAYMKASRQARTGMISNSNYNAGITEDTTNVSNYICIELKDGSKFRALGSSAILEHIKQYGI